MKDKIKTHNLQKTIKLFNYQMDTVRLLRNYNPHYMLPALLPIKKEINLKNAAIDFEQAVSWAIREGLCTIAEITTQYCYQYGELHRIYFDVSDLSKEDPQLVKVVEPFISHTNMILSNNDAIVVNLRNYLNTKNVFKVTKITESKNNGHL